MVTLTIFHREIISVSFRAPKLGQFDSTVSGPRNAASSQQKYMWHPEHQRLKLSTDLNIKNTNGFHLQSKFVWIRLVSLDVGLKMIKVYISLLNNLFV